MLQAVKFIRIPDALAYYLHLDNLRQIRALQYRFKRQALVYGIHNQLNQMIYIGSTMTPSLRFHKHLVTSEQSNTNLQEAIHVDGLENFTVHVFELVSFPDNANFNTKQCLLRQVEQRYIDMFPRAQFYNTINSRS